MNAAEPVTADTDDPDPQQAPAWFLAAIAAPVETGEVSVDGVGIRYRAWGPDGADGLVLVHGGAAQSRWWDHIAPLLAGRHRVVALDLSGHGDSGRRPSYSFDSWAEEVMAVSVAAGVAGEPIIVGHSMGGFVTLAAATRFGDRIAGAITIDSPVRDLTPEELAARERVAFGPLKVYPSRQAALSRFRTVPPQRTVLPYVLAHLASTSVREVGGGWTWKFDPLIFHRPALTPSLLSRLDCRVALFRAEHGMVTVQMSEILYDRLGRVAPVIEIPDAAHHVMLDRPLALVTGIRTLVADWAHSLPQR
jgi:pimeloyl-ACP methyl ester carboxylesterase